METNKCCKCNCKAIYLYHEDWFCKKHIPKTNTLCEYLPGGLFLSNIDETQYFLTDDPLGDENCKILNGYINLRINGYPIFRDQEDSIPLVFFTSPGEQFNKITLAKEISKTVEYILSRPDIYNINDVDFADIKLESIYYNNYDGLFVAKLDRY